MVLTTVIYRRSDPFLPKFGEVLVIGLVNFKTVAVRIEQVCKRWYHIDWVSGNDYHLLCTKGSRPGNVLRIVRLCDPNHIRVTCNVLTEKAHHRLKEGVLDGHVSPCEHPRDLLKISPKESVAAANKRLESNFVSCQVRLTVKEDTFIVACHLLKECEPLDVL